jgi:glycerate dehydrogenase
MRTVFLDFSSLFPDDLDPAPLHGALPQLALHAQTEPEQVAARIADAEAVIVNKVVLDAALIAAAPRLRLILIAATGTDNVDLAAAQARGIAVCNCRGYGTASVAQHTLALLLALATRLPDYQRAVAAGEWARSPHFCLMDFPIMELAGKTLGIVGYGELGHAVARLAEAFGMRVLLAARPGAEPAPDRLPLAELLPRLDALSLHCPLTPATRGLIGEPELRALPRHALLVNTARGGLVDEQALARALREGWIGGAGLDVLSAEPPPADHPLLAPDLPNLIVTPHSAWGSRESRQRMLEQIAENARAFLAGAPVRRVV